jgi:hypothetical protein
MPFFHLAVDVIERDWITIEAPDIKTAYDWGVKKAAKVYQPRDVWGKDIEFGGDVDPVPLGKEKHYVIKARLGAEGEEITEPAEDDVS